MCFSAFLSSGSQKRIDDQKRIKEEKAEAKKKLDEQRKNEEELKRVEDRIAQLIKDLSSKKAADRIKAAEALRDMGTEAKDASEALCNAMLDSRRDVVTGVAAALEKVNPQLHKPVLALLVDNQLYIRIQHHCAF